MKNTVKLLVIGVLFLTFAMPCFARAAEQDLQQKIDQLSRELDTLKQQVKKNEEKSLGRWLEVSGDYRFRYDNLQGSVAPHADGLTVFSNVNSLIAAMNAGTIAPLTQPALFGAAITGGAFGPLSLPSAQRDAFDVKNDALYTNRFGLNLKAKATQNVTVTTRFLMYKVWGSQDDSALRSGNTAFSLDRAGLFDGTIGHVPGDSKLAVDRVYATWSNIADQPIWFSIGRRPATGGIPSHLRENNEPPGSSGVPALLVNYAFDGVTLGYAPDIDMLPGAYAKLCYGRGFQNDIENADRGNSLHNTDMIGLNVVPYDTDRFRAELQYNKGKNIFDAPKMLSGPFPLTTNDNLGDIDWYGIAFLGKMKNIGKGNLHWFVDGAVSRTQPNGHTLKFNGIDTGNGLLFSGAPEDRTGWAVYAGGRYDITSTGTKIGLEYNHGSKDWITFAPAADDMWTSKVGVRGDVYEFYVIQELKLKPISSYTSKTFFRVGYQYYDFGYTGSNSWLGAPIKISELTNMTPQLTAPLKTAQDLYATFEVHF